ncbi:antitoxin [Methanocalculus taiwanensis]|uniref:Antitoxin n=1 Tax=Methanocalculus taiwanensis TaxID=106207 RepID=A0ABD4TG10_9EURY|nr:antitoxin VapB family protein [Methanocalculus taiwanensis]MCQ1537446.1 antitoxin [Methanocalculus taiwanensis]
MGYRTIRISDEAYDRLLSLKKGTKMSYSEVILRYTPQKKMLSEVLRDNGPNPELADSIENESREMR